MSKSLLHSPIERFTRMMFSRVIERLAVVIAEEDLSFSQVAGLHIIDQTERVSIQDLALRLNLSLSATSRLVDDLVTRELLDRVEDQENRRSKLLTLTSRGQDFLNGLSIERVKIIKSAPKALFETLGK